MGIHIRELVGAVGMGVACILLVQVAELKLSAVLNVLVHILTLADKKLLQSCLNCICS